MKRQEWKRLFHNPLLLVVMVAVVAIPTIYTTLFLGSMWDPYGSVEHLPVAVVNLDRPVTVADTTYDIGQSLVDNLKEEASLDFHFVGREEAQQGLTDGTYYMVITIPQDFSQRAASITDAHPQAMELGYETNPGTNYIASKLGESAMKEMELGVREEVTRTYAATMLEQIGEIGDGMTQAAEGGGELKDGAHTLTQGAQSLTDYLAQLSDSSLTFVDGSQRLSQGLGDYLAGVTQVAQGSGPLNDGAAQLEDGLGQLQQATGPLAQGVEQLSQGARSMAQGAEQAATSSDTLAQGAAQVDESLGALVEGLGQLQSQTQALPETAQALSDGAKQLEQGLQGLSQALQSGQVSGEQLQALVGQLEQGAQRLNQGLGQLKEQAPALSQGITQAAQGAGQLKDQGTAPLRAGAAQLQQGLDTLAQGSGTLSQGVDQLQAQLPALTQGVDGLYQGAQKLHQGTQTLVDGAGQLMDNQAQLTQGMDALAQGSVQIQDAAGQLHQGAQTLTDGANALEDGAAQLQEKLAEGAREIADTNTSDTVAEMMAAPVETQESQLTQVPNNGHAMAPYMMSVALWVGCIAFSLMYPLTQYSGELKSGFAWWRSKASVLYTVAIAEALVMLGSLHLFNGFQPVDWPRTVLVALVAAVTFMSVMYLFTCLLGKVGSFLMLIFMVLQLSGSVGTYPLELSGSFVPALNGWVPFTYTVRAFRSAICGGPDITGCLAYLAIWFVVATLLTLVLFQVRTRRIRAKQPTLMVWLEEHSLA